MTSEASASLSGYVSIVELVARTSSAGGRDEQGPRRTGLESNALRGNDVSSLGPLERRIWLGTRCSSLRPLMGLQRSAAEGNLPIIAFRRLSPYTCFAIARCYEPRSYIVLTFVSRRRLVSARPWTHLFVIMIATRSVAAACAGSSFRARHNWVPIVAGSTRRIGGSPAATIAIKCVLPWRGPFVLARGQEIEPTGRVRRHRSGIARGTEAPGRSLRTSSPQKGGAVGDRSNLRACAEGESSRGCRDLQQRVSHAAPRLQEGHRQTTLDLGFAPSPRRRERGGRAEVPRHILCILASNAVGRKGI